MTNHDAAIRRFLQSYCERNTFAASCEAEDFRILLFETLDFGWHAIAMHPHIPGLIFSLEHDDMEQETHLTVFRRDQECTILDEEAGATF